MKYGIATSKNATTRSRIRWSADKKTLYFDGRALKMEELIKFVHELLNMAEKIMSEHLLFQQNGDIPDFDISIVDNPSKHEAGYYFALQQAEAWNKARIRMIQRIRAAKL